MTAVAVAIAGAFAAPALAQQADTPAAKERIEVTGSNIKRVEGETALPVTVITKEDINRSGATNAMELLQLVGANSSVGSVTPSSTIGATTFSAQTANLRGLTGGRDPGADQRQARERVRGRAERRAGCQPCRHPVRGDRARRSAEGRRLGRIRLRRDRGRHQLHRAPDYRGAEATIFAGTPTRSGGGKQETYSGALGFGDLNKDRYNVFVSAAFNDQHNLLQKDRDFSNTAYRADLGLNTLSSNTFPGNVTTGSIGIPGGVSTCSGPYATYFPDLSSTRCFFDPANAPGVEGIPDTKNTNFFGQAKFQINQDWQAYGTALYSKDENRFIIQPVPISNSRPLRSERRHPRHGHREPGPAFLPHRRGHRGRRERPGAERAHSRAS